MTLPPMTAAERAEWIRSRLPAGGLFAGHEWRIAPDPFRVGPALAGELETLGRVLLQFYRALNLLYRHSLDGKQPEWVAHWLDQGKPPELLAIQRAAAFKNEVPRVIRPDLLLTEDGVKVTELDSVPGGIGLTAWLNQTYGGLPGNETILGGTDGMLRGFASIFNAAAQVHIVISEEASTYRPEMEWLAAQLGADRFAVRDVRFTNFLAGSAIYRFFELFDLPQVANSAPIFTLAAEKRIQLTPPPKAIFEEKLAFALLWNRNLREFWRRELGEGFLIRLLKLVPYTWVVDPAPLPPHGAIPELNITDWRQLKTLSQRERDLVLKISGFSPEAWGARGVYIGSDLSSAEWSVAVDRALTGFSTSPFVLQRFLRTVLTPVAYHDFSAGTQRTMPGRARLCPYYFVSGDGPAARANLGGVLATICPADKKIIHGMRDAVILPCAVSNNATAA
ncbi:MAG: hypothetical protein WCO56_18095 [Verrucomicrobiota bacterium]